MDTLELTNYLCQSEQKLRDRNYQQQAIEQLGTEGFISICDLIQEVITKTTSGLSQITPFKSIYRNYNNTRNDQESPSIGIRIKLTYNPTEAEMRQSGHQMREQDPRNQKRNQNDLYQSIKKYSSELSTIKFKV
ncbi:unnamed protein product (macronuclear) [Paramecium tetraurelia]|uniref:Uncharacterized protein n=1 Tax=Paramecium tetraurelia TaxID=5888 RepID=A0BQJ1_PARTE|nr:uncharacterized protein GSPATT00031037001 [Paramecium tetraurelia]CAK60808.1 unnamed protein product [Paramecium tetraurelia]|eukprot:XP_001428206.1 hypothetical protein (macronuclear) [Paramecium tetraurelia strain d4-2]